MHCTKCSFENPAGMRFCGQCATPLSMPCPGCGYKNPPNFEFCGQCATPLTKANDNTIPSEPSSRTSSISQEAERRQLTVLFCDMVGSSALSASIDPEELRDIMRNYRTTCNEVITRYDGHIAQYLGDGILVYFGYPHAHEDDARRAAHAALEIVKHIQEQHYPVQNGKDIQIAVRIGVHTGLVVVGEIGDGDKRTLALGETPNIAARIQDHAAANSVIVSSATHRLLGEQFECESLGIPALKGFSQPLELFQIHKAHDQKHILSAARKLGHSLLIGRDQETSLLLERLEQARKGVGQIVLLSSEPGMGKTRIAQMVCEKVTDKSCILLECAGSPYYQNSFLFPIMGMVRRILNLENTFDNVEQIACIDQTIATLGLDAHKITPILAELLSIPLSGQYASTVEFTPQQKKQQTLDTLVTLLQTIAQQRFVLLIVEDLQWVDPSTLELLSKLIHQPGLTNIFALFTFRSEFIPPWPFRANLTRINLNLLTRQQSGSLIRHLCRRKTLPLEVFSEIIGKTDGIPLFVEELTNTVLRSNILVEKKDHFELNAPMSQLGIPSTLQDSLMSRLDDLGEDKELAQLSATLGREFDHELLSAVSTEDENSLRQGLNRLINAELFLQQGQHPRVQYSFRHALLREAAYYSLLRRTRQKYHQRIASLLKERFPHVTTENPELLAHHYTEAGNLDDALNFWLAAGRYAVQRSANIEAIAHLKNGLIIIDQQPDTPQYRMCELALQTTLGLAIIMSKGYAAPEVEQAYARARILCKDIADTNAVFPILSGLWEFYIVRADLDAALKLADELQLLANQSPAPGLELEAKRALGTTLFWQGNFEQALQYLEPGKGDTPDSEAFPSTLVSYCQDAHVATLSNASMVLWLLGYPDQALERAKQALDLAKRLSHPFSQAYALHFIGTLSQLRGDRKATLQHADAQIALSETYGFPFWAATGKMLKAWCESNNNTLDKACADFQQAFEDYKASGNRLAKSYFKSILAEMLLKAGHLNDAQQVIEKALEQSTATGERFFNAELVRIKGEIAIANNKTNSGTAETFFTTALELAKTQNARSLVLRISTSLARLWQQQANAEDAKSLLTEHLNHINEGASTADILAAQQLLISSEAGANPTSDSPVH